MAHVIRDKKKMLDRVRRIRGQVESVERSLEGDAECSEILHTIAACQGAINGLMAELIAGHIRFHVIGPRVNPNSPQARAAEELIDVIRKYVH
jgi:DNA-binding FrmR family transcriptional regulator